MLISGRQSLTIEYFEKEIIFFVVEKKNVEGKYLEKEKIFLWRRRRMEKEKEENIWRGKTYFLEKKKSGEVKGGNYLEKENLTMTIQQTSEQ